MTDPRLVVRVVTTVTPEVVEILLPAVGGGSYPELSARIRTATAASTTVSAHRAGRLVAAACIDVEGSRGRLSAIGVSPDHRRRGIGRSLISALPALLGLTVITAETDSDAVGFYRALGFTTTSLGEKYPGVERFRCHLTPAADTDQAPPAAEQRSTVGREP